MDIKNTRQFLPGYHTITGYETVRIRGGHDRYCQAQDAATDMGRKVFHLGVTKRQLDRWKLPLREGMTIQDYSGSYRVEEISVAMENLSAHARLLKIRALMRATSSSEYFTRHTRMNWKVMKRKSAVS